LTAISVDITLHPDNRAIVYSIMGSIARNFDMVCFAEQAKTRGFVASAFSARLCQQGSITVHQPLNLLRISSTEIA